MEYVAHIRKTDESEQRLESHLFEVGELAAGFAAKAGLPDAGLLLGLLHDFGKGHDNLRGILWHDSSKISYIFSCR